MHSEISRGALRIHIETKSTLREEARRGQEDFYEKLIRINPVISQDLQPLQGKYKLQLRKAPMRLEIE